MSEGERSKSRGKGPFGPPRAPCSTGVPWSGPPTERHAHPSERFPGGTRQGLRTRISATEAMFPGSANPIPPEAGPLPRARFERAPTHLQTPTIAKDT